jgi:hypothetical protein
MQEMPVTRLRSASLEESGNQCDTLLQAREASGKYQRLAPIILVGMLQ